MPKAARENFLAELRIRYGSLNKLDGTNSVFEIQGSGVRVYVRYSKLHSGDRTFYGLRQDDLAKLEGRAAVIAFVWDDQNAPLLIPYSPYETLFTSLRPAADGQHKVQVFMKPDGMELYVSRAGRFGVGGYEGWSELSVLTESTGQLPVPSLSHAQVQTMLGAIGTAKGFDIWIPVSDRSSLDWNLVEAFTCRNKPIAGYDSIDRVIHEVDVIWLDCGTGRIHRLYEVEHSTPIYSGLLRFNDIHLQTPSLQPTYCVVANSERRDTFVRQINRPTFKHSGLDNVCSFFEYSDVYAWFKRISLSH